MEYHMKCVHKREQELTRYDCYKCEAKYKTSYDLNKHIISHSGQERINCDERGIECKTLDHLTMHERRHHILTGQFEAWPIISSNSPINTSQDR